MKIEGNNRMISLMVVAMSIVVVAGSLSTAGIMKAYGFPKGDWKPLSVFVRTNGYVFLLIPFAWGLLALLTRKREDDSRMFTAMVVVGVVLFLGLIYFFIGTAVTCRASSLIMVADPQ